jgi:hypothetical protein
MGFGDERKRISRGDVRNLGLSGLSSYLFSFLVKQVSAIRHTRRITFCLC